MAIKISTQFIRKKKKERKERKKKELHHMFYFAFFLLFYNVIFMPEFSRSGLRRRGVDFSGSG